MAASLSLSNMEPDHPQFIEITKEFGKFLTTNSSLIADSTGDFLNLCLQLLANKVISDDERAEINIAGIDKKQILYMVDCFKKRGFTFIPEIIKSYENTANAPTVPNLLKKFWNSKVEPRLNPANTTSGQKPKTDSANSNSERDLEVTDFHRKDIAGILLKTLNESHWKEIKETWLSSAIRNSIGQQSSMKLDILKALEEWISKTKKEDRVFSKFIKVFDGYESTKEALIEWKDSELSE